MPNPARWQDLADRGYEGPASETVQTTRLDEVYRALCREDRTLESRMASGDPTQNDVTDVVCAAALRVLRNPEGAKSQSSSIDDYSETTELADASADIYFTAAELRRLQPAQVYSGGYSGSFRYCR